MRNVAKLTSDISSSPNQVWGWTLMFCVATGSPGAADALVASDNVNPAALNNGTAQA